MFAIRVPTCNVQLLTHVPKIKPVLLALLPILLGISNNCKRLLILDCLDDTTVGILDE